MLNRNVVLVGHFQQFKAHRNQYFIDILCLQYPQMPRTRDLVIFVPTTTTTTTTDRQTDCFTPCACTRGNYFFSLHSIRINTVASRGLFIINVFAVGRLVPRKEVLHNPHSLVPSPIPVFSMLHAEKTGTGLDIRIHIQNCCWV